MEARLRLFWLLLGGSLLTAGCNQRLAPETVAPGPVLPVSALEEVVAEIGPEGGTLSLPGATITVPAGAVAEKESFTLQRLASPPAPLTGDALLELTDADRANYFISSSTSEFEVPLSIEFYTESAEDSISAAYAYQQPTPGAQAREWSQVFYAPGLEVGGPIYSLPPLPKYLDRTTPVGKQENAGVYINTSRYSEKAVNTFCTSKGGTFNGVYCMFPWRSPTNSDVVKIMSLQAGNAAAWCNKYAVKLCYWTGEQHVRDFIQEHDPDIIAVQEFYNRYCNFLDEDEGKICGWALGPEYAKFAKQSDRIFYGTPYEVACREYECVAIKRDKFEFVDKEAEYLDGGCSEDTGFQVVRIRPKSFPGPIASPLSDIEIANAHLASPVDDESGSCRGKQLEALYERYKPRSNQGIPVHGTPEDPWAIPTLVMGDFNVDPILNLMPGVPIPDDLRDLFKKIFAWKGGPGVPGNHGGGQIFYLQLGPGEPSYDDSQQGAAYLTLDHVASNFATTQSCFRDVIKEESLGLGAAFDHKTTICELEPFGSAIVQAYIWERDPAGTVSPHPTTHNIQAEAKYLGVRLRPLQLTHPSSQERARVDLYYPSGNETEVTYIVTSCQPYVPRSEPIPVDPLEPGGVKDLGRIYIDVSPYMTCHQ